MRRILVIFLLIIVPFQFSWAAAGDYCQHESGRSAIHFGHHVHQHQDGAEKSQSSVKSAKSHPDCGACHGAGSALFSQQSDVWGFTPGEILAPAAAVHYTSHIPEGPLRPDRSTLI
ncbi:cation efflux protein, CzcI family [Duganella sp. P38]|uniref:cation efflux protein, CzcI family n=1 Tax=Duganella sp. P38 TaxID=3423949 RepID=UPI003D7A37AD